MTSHADYILRQLSSHHGFTAEANFFFEALSAAEIHWFFVQGLSALRHELYLPGISALLNGIEASLRITLDQIQGTYSQGTRPSLSPYRVLSNPLLASSQKAGLPVDALAFPGEGDFLRKLSLPKEDRKDVEIVRLRNNICHGNILEFITVPSEGVEGFFSPYSMRPVSAILLSVSFQWAKALGGFRRSEGLMSYGPTPDIPSSPLIF